MLSSPLRRPLRLLEVLTLVLLVPTSEGLRSSLLGLAGTPRLTCADDPLPEPVPACLTYRLPCAGEALRPPSVEPFVETLLEEVRAYRDSFDVRASDASTANLGDLLEAEGVLVEGARNRAEPDDKRCCKDFSCWPEDEAATRCKSMAAARGPDAAAW